MGKKYSKASSSNLERIGFAPLGVPEDDPREATEEEKKAYKREFNLAKKVGIVTISGPDDYEVKGAPLDVLEARCKEVEGYCIFKRNTKFRPGK